nr:unnamed protein product [Callosobruchus chinensis]
MRRGDREMKKFTIKGVLDNFRNSVAQPQSASSRLCDQEVQETLKTDHFQVKRTKNLCFRSYMRKASIILGVRVAQATWSKLINALDKAGDHWYMVAKFQDINLWKHEKREKIDNVENLISF